LKPSGKRSDAGNGRIEGMFPAVRTRLDRLPRGGPLRGIVRPRDSDTRDGGAHGYWLACWPGPKTTGTRGGGFRCV